MFRPGANGGRRRGRDVAPLADFFLANGGMSAGSPTRMNSRANACDRCSRYGGLSRGRSPAPAANARTSSTGRANTW